ncbi:hypothetical protein PFICI_07968 [Pestalotiopsis fici W106-1]|uniref:Uncharacterized protein n=1 Tax=Pestalotiopsis fici (strain W106-1 / CGMCC3.15140) TaxID=1229662 RepID=W3X355_PESFW|nr:uncharacterized protein PFICI_07968 [Pestalotiopsis fici W106-1]ETS80439.1 hypothetical protein PFICI_07968 [Pestalotiopsis fici W106-1]
MAPLATNVAVPLQRAIWSRTQYATCKLTPLNKALADALYRANYITWLTESGAHRPDASLLAQFSPEELRAMHIAHTTSRHKRQLWMGLRYRDDAWKRDNGWWLEKEVPVAKTILGKSQRQKTAPLVWSAAEVARLVRGEALGEDMWRKGLSEGQGVFLKIEDPDDRGPAHRFGKVEVLESREAAERGVGGSVVCRVWPFRKRVVDEETTSQDKFEEEEQALAEEAMTQQTR